jgi:CrcB protein
MLPPEMKLLLVTGFCGGFTTFSTFANESYSMMKAGGVLMTALYVGASVIIGILAVWGGMMLSGSVK